jgi:hypothetical protein
MMDLLLLRAALCSDTQETGSRFTRQSKVDGIVGFRMLPVGQQQLVDGEGELFLGLLRLEAPPFLQPLRRDALVLLVAIRRAEGPEQVVLAVEGDTTLTGGVRAVAGTRGVRTRIATDSVGCRELSRLSGRKGRTRNHCEVSVTASADLFSV